MNTVFITNIPAPYREKVHEIAGEKLNDKYHVIYCASIEANRSWKFELGKYEKTFLISHIFSYRGREIYLSSNIRQVLRELDPSVVIIGGFSLPMIIAYVWALVHRRKIISFSDANIDSEKRLSFLHKYIRAVFYGVSSAFLGASKKTQQLFELYGAKKSQLFQSHLCANNTLFTEVSKSFEQRPFDVILCGQMIEGKMFDFSLDVITLMKKEKKDVSVKILGSGPLKDHILSRLDELGIDYDYPGFVGQHELPGHYSAAKIFFFPTLREAWGVVANESCAAGTPVLTCDAAGAANELILNGHNGYVSNMNPADWASKAMFLLKNPSAWEKMSSNARTSVDMYTYENAAQGLVSASKYVEGQ